MKKLLLLIIVVWGMQAFTACSNHSTVQTIKKQIQQVNDCCGDDDIPIPDEDEN